VVVRTHGRNTGSFQGRPIEADEWTTNLLIDGPEGWRCVLTQLTPETNPRESDSMPEPEVQITIVEPALWSRFRDLRLAALAESPEMFSSTLSREREFDESEWHRRAQRPVTFLASRGPWDVGLAGVHEFEAQWTIVGMWVSPAARGTGVVDALVEACETAARQAGADAIVLGVMEDNRAGCRAYRRLGYRPTGQREHLRDGRYEIWMTKRLSSRRSLAGGTSS
jgi:ribosomal protein S18 acetylase RimI-like enzyme